MDSKKVIINRIAIIAELSDGTYKQVMVTADDQKLWLDILHNFYNPIRILDHNLEGLFFGDPENFIKTWASQYEYREKELKDGRCLLILYT